MALQFISHHVWTAFVLYIVLGLITLGWPTMNIPWQPLHNKLVSGIGNGSDDDDVSKEEEHGVSQSAGALDTVPVDNNNFIGKLYLLATSAEAIVFFSMVLIMGFAVGTIESFLFLYLEDLGGSETLMGLTLTFTCIAETLVFAYSGQIIHALGIQGCLNLCFFAFLVRLGSYATLKWWWGAPWSVLPVELLHGITFGLTWSCGTAKSALITPPGLEATTQSAFQGMMFGVGFGVGGHFGHALRVGRTNGIICRGKKRKRRSVATIGCDAC